MADALIFPNISFDESDVGPRPIISAAGNRIGVVGEFLRGPFNQFTLVDTPETLMKLFGKTTHNGSLAIQTAMDQGARDFGVIRVMGSPVQAGAYLKFALANAATIANSGKVMLMMSGVKASVIGNGVTTREELAELLVQGVNASTMPMTAQRTGNVVTLTSSSPALANLPIMLRMVDPNDLLGRISNSGIIIRDKNGVTVAPDSIIRLVSGTVQLTFDYDLTASAAQIDINEAGAVDGDTLTVQIGNVSRTATIDTAPALAFDFSTAPAVGEVVNLVIDGVTQSHTVTGADTAQTILTDLVTKFAGTAPMTRIDLAAVGGVLNITPKANVAFTSVTVTSSITPVGVNPVVGVARTLNAGGNPATSIGPRISTPEELAANLARMFAAHPLVDVTASTDKLIVAPKAGAVFTTIPLGAAGSAAALSGTPDRSAIVAPTGVVTSTDIHLLVGAEADVTGGVSTDETVATDLAKSINDRGLTASAELSANRKEIHLVSRVAGADGNRMLYAVIQQRGGSVAAIDANLAITNRPQVLGVAYAEAANGGYYAFGGGAAGPKKASAIVRRRKFVRAQALGALTSPGGVVTLTLSSGEVAINKTAKLELAGKTAVMPNSSAISVVVDEQGNLSTKLAPGANEVVIGTYSAGPNGAAGTYTPAPAVNGNLLRVDAASEGVWGKDVYVSPVFQSETGSIKLIVAYKDVANENHVSETLEFRLSASGALDGSVPYPLVRAASQAALVRVYYLGDEASKTDEVLQDGFFLEGGEDGPVVGVQDYLNALDRMAVQPINILVASGRTETTIRDRMLAQAAASDEISGMRIAVLAADPRLEPTNAKNITNGLDSKYGVMVVGWATYSGRNDLAPLSVPPDGFYAGHMAATPIEASVAARTSSPAFRGITEVDTRVGTGAFDLYTRARLDCIIPDQATKVFHMLNGRTLSVDAAWYWVSLRRVYNHIRANVFQGLQFAKSEPNSPQLQRRVADTIDNLLFAMFSKGQIAGYQPTKADGENNPPNLVAQGMLRVDVFFTPVYPADFIGVGIHRVIPVSVTVSTGN